MVFLSSRVSDLFSSVRGCAGTVTGEARRAVSGHAFDGEGTGRDEELPGLPWIEWEGGADKRPAEPAAAERAASIQIGAIERRSPRRGRRIRQNVELTWRSAGGEQQVRYVAQARSIEPRYYRTISTNTFLVGAAAGFVAGLFLGRVLRRRWLTQPGYFAAPTQNN